MKAKWVDVEEDGKLAVLVPEVLHIQCKNNKVEKPLSKEEKDALIKLAKQTSGKAIHVYNSSRHKLVFEELN